MHAQSKPHTCKAHNIYAWSMTEEQGMSRHERMCASEKFADVSKVVQPLPTLKRHGVVTLL